MQKFYDYRNLKFQNSNFNLYYTFAGNRFLIIELNGKQVSGYNRYSCTVPAAVIPEYSLF